MFRKWRYLRMPTCAYASQVLAIKVQRTMSSRIHRDHPVPLVNFRDAYITTKGGAHSVQFISPLKLMITATDEGFLVVNLENLETQPMLDSADISLQFALKNNVKPMAVFHSLTALLVCYEKFSFHVDARGRMALNGTIMRWKSAAIAFAQHDSHILVFGLDQVEVWNIETPARVQTRRGRHLLLNSRNMAPEFRA
ncbi:citron-like protein [Mycena maculata]|uniref:Citron-like protein n=1 Tax=Mycena maculata TaxID=230809 RepID=A0AAD7JF29_9AGAR|nr:citron-like protein [Mycena maculata]